MFHENSFVFPTFTPLAAMNRSQLSKKMLEW